MRTILLISFIILGSSCSNNEPDPGLGEFANPARVTIDGYNGHAMEPFISSDGQTLFFNNFGNGVENGDIHYAVKEVNGDFKYIGLVQGINTSDLEGVPNLDLAGNFYYTSVATYFDDLLSIYGGPYENGTVTAPVAVDQKLTLNIPGYLDMDAAISPDGSTMYLAIGKFSVNSFPDEANFIIANRVNGEFIKDNRSDEILANINTDKLEYAASISYDGLTLYFNRTDISSLPYKFSILKATRVSKDAAFAVPEIVNGITGEFTEGASISADDRELYYHQKINNLFLIYKVSR